MLKNELIDFESRYVPVTESGCWLWLSGCTGSGYGVFYIKKKQTPAHRVSYTHFKGKIPKGLVLDHLCRVQCCVNPDHLECVSYRTNTLRGIGVSAENAKKLFCKYGHPFTTENTELSKHKYGYRRKCRVCRKLECRKRRANMSDKEKQQYLKRRRDIRRTRNQSLNRKEMRSVKKKGKKKKC